MNPAAEPAIEIDDRDTADETRAGEASIGIAHYGQIPSVLNAAILVAQVAIIFVFFRTAAMVTSSWAMALLSIGFALFMISVFGTIHEAEHGILFSNSRANVAGGIVAASLFPAPFHLLRQGHIGHHLRNRSDDEALDLWFEGESPIWKWMQWIGILTGFFYLMIVLGNVIVLFLPFLLHRRWFQFDRPSAAFMDSLNPRYLRATQLEAIAIILLHPCIILSMRIPMTHYLALYTAFGCLWSALQYVHHYGTERHIVRGARNLWLFWPIDKLWLNHNWHRVHHEHPTVSWLYLEQIGTSRCDDRTFLPWAYLKMWSGPRKAADHVQNRFAGKVIR